MHQIKQKLQFLNWYIHKVNNSQIQHKNIDHNHITGQDNNNVNGNNHLNYEKFVDYHMNYQMSRPYCGSDNNIMNSHSKLIPPLAFLLGDENGFEDKKTEATYFNQVNNNNHNNNSNNHNHSTTNVSNSYNSNNNNNNIHLHIHLFINRNNYNHGNKNGNSLDNINDDTLFGLLPTSQVPRATTTHHPNNHNHYSNHHHHRSHDISRMDNIGDSLHTVRGSPPPNYVYNPHSHTPKTSSSKLPNHRIKDKNHFLKMNDMDDLFENSPVQHVCPSANIRGKYGLMTIVCPFVSIAQVVSDRVRSFASMIHLVI